MAARRRRCGSALGWTAFGLLLLAATSATRADELPLLGNGQPPPQQRRDPPPPAAQNPAPPEQPPTIGSFPRSFVIPGTQTSVTISGSVQTNFRSGSSR